MSSEVRTPAAQRDPMGPTAERMLHLDVLRGFALLGILFVNFQWFTRPLQAIVFGAEPGLEGTDRVVDFAIMTLAEGKFYALFSMLFGAGFALMASRAMAHDTAFRGLYFRRLLLLALFGLLHLLLVWAGDILLVYALCGMLMMLVFSRTPVTRLWKWAIALLALSPLLAWAGALSIASTRGNPELYASIMQGFADDQAMLLEHIARAAVIHAEGSWPENVGQRLRDAGFLFSNALFWIPPILGYFLLGRWLLEGGRLSDPAAHQGFFRGWRLRGLLLGLPLSAGAAVLLQDGSQMTPTVSMAAGLSLMITGAVLLSLGYLSTVVLAAQRLQVLAPVGRMALTNYLCQSLVWTWLFYGHGAGLWGELPRWSHPLYVIGFFALQVVFSHWWLARFRFGPAEWLWRSLTYGHAQPMRRAGRSLSE